MLQKVIIEQFTKKHSDPTYKEMVGLTGMEQTRLFRIINGSAMKLNEFEIFLNLISHTESPLKLFLDCYLFLDSKSLRELENEIKRKITMANLKRSA